MDPIGEMVQKMLVLPEDELAQMGHAELYTARSKVKNQEDQNKLAKAEHRAFAREATAENPMMALPIAVATPLYQLYKMAQSGSRSEASLDQMMSGLIGVKEGISKALKDI